MRTRIIKQPDGKFALYNDDTGLMMKDGLASREAAKLEAKQRRSQAAIAKEALAAMSLPPEVTARLDNLQTVELVTVAFDCDELETSERLFTDEIEALEAEELLDEHGNVVLRAFREAFVLKPGTYQGVNGEAKFTSADIAEVVANFNPADPPPIQINHSNDPRDTLGYVTNMRVGTGDRLHELQEYRGAYAVGLVRAGLLRKMSVGIYRKPTNRMKETSAVLQGAVGGTGGEHARMLEFKPTTPEPEKLDANNGGAPAIQQQKEGAGMNFLQMLGAWMSRMRATKKDVKLSMTDDELTKLADGSEDIDEAKVRAAALELGVSKEEIDKAFALAAKADGKPAPTPTPAPTPAPIALADPAAAQELAKRDTLIAQLQQRLDAADAEKLAERNETICDKLQEAGRLLPKDRDKTLRLLGKLDDEGKTDFLAMHNLDKPEILFGRKSLPELGKPGGQSEAEAASEADAMMSDGGYSKNEKGEWVLA